MHRNATRFGWTEALKGNRFHAPVSEASLLEAGAAAGLREGETLLELACGNGAVCLFLTEEWHLYGRGIDASADAIEACRAHAERSPAGHRVRFFHEDPLHVPPGHGPLDLVVALRGAPPGVAELLRPGGRLLLGRFVARGEPEAEIEEAFPLAPVRADFPLPEAWRREATPLEWERFYEPQERALRAYRRSLRPGADVSPLALALERQIAAFRAHGGAVAYLLSLHPLRGEQKTEVGGT